MNTVIVYGPQGCGKTRNAEALRKHFGCTSIEDDWNLQLGLYEGALHLTSRDLSETQEISNAGWRKPGRVLSFEDAMSEMDAAFQRLLNKAVGGGMNTKPSNPKDSVGIRKWRQFATIPLTVLFEVGVAMMEGGLKYGRSNYRAAGVRASVYVDAAIGHIGQWWEGEDLDPDTRLSHITKAIASLIVLRDSMIQNMLNDDRPPKGNLDRVRNDLQAVVDGMFEKYPEGKAAFTEIGMRSGQGVTEVHLKSCLSPEQIDVILSAESSERPRFHSGGVVAAKPYRVGE